MRYDNVYFFNGTAYAGKSTAVKLLAERFQGIACGENYHLQLEDSIDERDFPAISYMKHLTDWGDFVRRTPDEYEAWVDRGSEECEILELRILDDLISKTDRPVFVDTNISLETLHRISDRDHVVIMLADPMISVNRFFERPDREKQYLYRLLLAEPDPDKALANWRECLKRVNSRERYDRFLNSGFRVILRDEGRTADETAELIAGMLNLPGK